MADNRGGSMQQLFRLLGLAGRDKDVRGRTNRDKARRAVKPGKRPGTGKGSRVGRAEIKNK